VSGVSGEDWKDHVLERDGEKDRFELEIGNTMKLPCHVVRERKKERKQDRKRRRDILIFDHFTSYWSNASTMLRSRAVGEQVKGQINIASTLFLIYIYVRTANFEDL